MLFSIYREEKDESQRTQPPPAEPNAPELDEDGYVIRPNVPHTWNNEKGSFYSSSDSDTGSFSLSDMI